MFRKGDVVEVVSRQWKKINREGGVAKITEVNDERRSDELLKDGSENGARTTDYTYNVKYVVQGSSEKRIDQQWIRFHEPQRPTRSIKRKCRQCGGWAIGHGPDKANKVDICSCKKEVMNACGEQDQEYSTNAQCQNDDKDDDDDYNDSESGHEHKDDHEISDEPSSESDL